MEHSIVFSPIYGTKVHIRLKNHTENKIIYLLVTETVFCSQPPKPEILNSEHSQANEK